MPQLDFDGAASRLSADNIRGQSGSTITIVSGHNLVGSGSGLTALNATNLASGTVPTARLGSGTANNGVFLRGDGTWAAAGVDGITSSADATAITINSSEQVSIPKPLLVGLSGSTAPKSVGAMEVESTVGQDNGLVVWTSTNNAGAMNMVSFRANTTTQVGSITSTSSATAFNTSSDYRLKENLVPMEGAIDRLNQLKPYRFNFIVDPNKVVDGFVAHEAQEVVPEAVTGEKDAVTMQGIDQAKIVPLLVGALQEAIGRIEVLEQEVATLKGE